ncbi:MAG TPA: hypothetical protein PK691_12135, partial [Thermomicrobiales bacterium]|nr:hypothetical protein [Thermomicrobiales bacterium]
MIRISFWNTYRSALVIFTVGMFFTNFADYSQRWGLIPLFWIVVFAALTMPAMLQGIYRGRVPVPPIFWWGLYYMMLSVLWFYRSPQDAIAYQNVQTRVLSVMFLMLCLIVCNRAREQLLARQAIAIAVLIATAL